MGTRGSEEARGRYERERGRRLRRQGERAEAFRRLAVAAVRSEAWSVRAGLLREAVHLQWVRANS